MKKALLAVALVISFAGAAQTINIPDAALKAKLTGPNVASVVSAYPEAFNNSVDTNGDGEIQTSEAAAVYGLKLSTSTTTTTGDITSLEGIQYFPNLKVLNCSGNNIASFDVTTLGNLEKLQFDQNHTQSLNVSGLSNLKTITCSSNNLTALNLSGLAQLQNFGCYNNNLTSLDLAGLNNLQYLDFSSNQVASIASPILPSVMSLMCNDNQLSAIDLHQFPNLQYANCGGNPISSINLDAMTHLTDLSVSNTLVTQIDCSQSSVQRLTCNGNPQLTYINVQNNQVSSGDPDMLDYPFHFMGLPLLTGVCVDLGEEQWMANAGIDPATVSIYYGPNCSGNPSNAYNFISGVFKFDAANDGCDAGDSPMEGLSTGMTINGGAPMYAFSNAAGQYHFIAAQNNVVITPSLVNPDYFTISPPSYNYNFIDTGNSYTADFCVTPNGFHPDLETYLSMGSASPGFNALYTIIYRNKGNQAQSGSLTFTFDDAVLDYVIANNPPASQATNTLSWNFTNLLPFETRQIIVMLNLNSPVETPPLNSGDQLTFITAITSDLADQNPADNEDTAVQTVVNSYDPNEKSVSEGDKIGISEIDNYLHYTILFQNMGTADAVNVSVKDMLSDNLDTSTLQVISASHPYRSTLTAGNKLDFNFENINLPPASVNEAGSHGFVTFKIKPKNTLVVDDIIDNTASIYFDFNSPIVTNTVSTTVAALGNADFQRDNFALYPNPAGNSVSIDLNGTSGVKSIGIYNTLGQLVAKIVDRPVGNVTADISGLRTGTYFVQIVTEEGKTTKKLLKI